MTQATYKDRFFQYPVQAAEDGLGFEGAEHRFRAHPTPEDVFKKALFGLPKALTLTNEIMTVEDCADYLSNAVTEIEMSTCMNISPVDHFQSSDHIEGLTTCNYTGIKLERWPATHIRYLQFKFPHTNLVSNIQGDDNPQQTGINTPGAYLTYTVPVSWIVLRKNVVNISASYGVVSINSDQSAIANAGGIFTYLTGINNKSYQPAMIEVAYTAGFSADRLPASVHDLIVTLASVRFLEDIFPVLIPYQSVNVTVDGVSQSATINLPQLILKRIELLQAQYKKKLAAINQNFGKTIRMTFLGA